MLIGSNNSLTYLEPSSWWLKLFRWLGRCQEVSYDDQYTYYGIRFFDFRVTIDDSGHIAAKNKKFTYPLNSIYEILDYFNKREDVTVLITLDISFNEHVSNYNTSSLENKFIEFCNILERIYEHVNFCGGYRKFDKKVLYEFNGDMPCIVRPSNWSFFYRFARKWCPFMVKRFNRMYIEKFKHKKGYLLLNYANRR